MKDELDNFKPGNELTLNCEIISVGGRIIFKKGDKVIIEEIIKDKGRWSRVTGCYIKPKVVAFKLENEYGHWSVSCFEETTIK